MQVGSVIGREFSHTLLAAVARKPETELASALNRIVEAGLLFRQGERPNMNYLFKHALVQDAAYGTLLREPRRALHARIAEALEIHFTEIAENQPELLARHFTEAGIIEKAVGLWSKAGQRSLARSASVEAVEQFTRALAQIAIITATPALRREEIRLCIALANALMITKGFAAAETKSTLNRARSLIERAEELGERPDDPLILFSLLFGFWIANYVQFNGIAALDLATQFVTLAEKQATPIPLMIGNRILGISMFETGLLAQGCARLDRAVSLIDRADDRSLEMRFGSDNSAILFSQRARALWALGYPEAGLADTDQAMRNARKGGRAVTLMSVAFFGSFVHFFCGSFPVANAMARELITLADEKGGVGWKGLGFLQQGIVYAVTGKHPDAVDAIASGLPLYRSTGSSVHIPVYLAYLARAYADVNQVELAWRYIEEARTTAEASGQTYFDAEIDRIAGEIALMSPQRDAGKAYEYYDSALAVARKQQAKSWELRAAMSMARLWRDQGKPQQARELLAPVYGWFTEGFNTLDLKEAKALLEELA